MTASLTSVVTDQDFLWFQLADRKAFKMTVSNTFINNSDALSCLSYIHKAVEPPSLRHIMRIYLII